MPGGLFCAAFLTHALRLNKLPDSAEASAAAASSGSESAITRPWAVEWKVLVMDQQSRAVLCHLMPVSELRRLGATLHLSLEAHREAVAGVPAVYIAAVSTFNLLITVVTREGIGAAGG